MLMLPGYLKNLVKTTLIDVAELGGSTFHPPSSFNHKNMAKLIAALPNNFIVIPITMCDKDSGKGRDKISHVITGNSPAALWNYWNNILGEIADEAVKQKMAGDEEDVREGLFQYWLSITSILEMHLKNAFEGIQLEPLGNLHELKTALNVQHLADKEDYFTIKVVSHV